MHIPLHINKMSKCHIHKLQGDSCKGCTALGEPLGGKEFKDYINCYCVGEPDYSTVAGNMRWDITSEHLDQLLAKKHKRETLWIKHIDELCTGGWKINQRQLHWLIEKRLDLRVKQPTEPDIEKTTPQQLYLKAFTDTGGILH